MAKKIDGTVSFYLRSKNGADVTETKYEAAATLYKKDQKRFLFFEESSMEDDSVTKCRMEFDEETIRIRRDGHLIMDQQYKIHKEIQGYFKTPFGELPTRVKTHRYKLLQESEHRLVIGLAYELFISEDNAGKYDLKVQFDKEAAQ
ncbi:MAG: DUF1934 domain-containing protein [Turicibacter sp.]|nr:DUF1934 domain-containing protein [Turicibacter sp.]